MFSFQEFLEESKQLGAGLHKNQEVWHKGLPHRVKAVHNDGTVEIEDDFGDRQKVSHFELEFRTPKHISVK